jgi:Major Facilitator Superfamily
MSTDPRFAEPTPFARLVYAQAVSVCGDACLTVSLAGSLFFQSPTSAARGKVLLYLLITMAPFAIVAPVLGPALDRTKGGRRMLMILSAAGRAVLCLGMALYITKPAPEGLLVYPLAFGVLVLAKGAQIAKSALVPALVKDDAELVNANSRLALVSVIAAAVGGLPAAAVYHLFGADWSLRLGAVVFAIAAVLALQIPKVRSKTPADARQEKLEREELHTPSILLGGSAMAVLRACIGFLVFFTAFSLKNDILALFFVGGASVLGNFIGVVLAPVLRRSAREEVILASSLVLPATFALLGAFVAGVAGFVLAAFTLALGAGAGRLGFDSLLQRDGPDAARGRAFAKFETRFQLVWVIGGMIAIIPFAKQMGLFLLAVVLGFAAVSYVAALRAARGRVMRSKLLPEAVDRTISRSRDEAVDRVRRRFRKSARTRDQPPPADP